MGKKRKSTSDTPHSAKRWRPLAPGDQDTASSSSSGRRTRGQPYGQASAFAVSADDCEDGDAGVASTKEAMAYLRTVRYELPRLLSRDALTYVMFCSSLMGK
jgi:hypothetical protein